VEEPTTAIKNSELDRMFALLALGDEILMSRLFILQVAAEDSWQVAKEVELYQNGKFRNQYYQKAMEKKEKREREEKKFKERLALTRQQNQSRRPYGTSYRGRGNFNSHASSNGNLELLWQKHDRQKSVTF